MKIGIALGGGGAKGFAHIGVLKSLTRAGIDCHLVSGTSIGAMVGAVYAAGGLEKLEEAARRIRLRNMPFLFDFALPWRGVFGGQRVVKLLESLVDVKHIEQLLRPFAAVSVDLIEGKIVTFTRGNLINAVRASISIPGVFTPVIMDGMVLIDGGALEPVPVEAARSLGADFVIAVDLLASTEGAGARKPYGIMNSIFNPTHPSLLDVIQRTSVVTQRSLTKYRMAANPPDFIIAPPVSHVGVFDFHLGESVMEIGRRAAELALPRLLDMMESRRGELP